MMERRITASPREAPVIPGFRGRRLTRSPHRIQPDRSDQRLHVTRLLGFGQTLFRDGEAFRQLERRRRLAIVRLTDEGVEVVDAGGPLGDVMLLLPFQTGA